ncbi:MAG TPA: methyltransferase domain-containing protein [Acidimicrobiales bacterium]|nr:methyltransferase domain-containing protein [Acidimicrobiales bacterium]
MTRLDAASPARPPGPDHRYTHGHHESVLRSHRWRTAENSAAYLLPSLRPGLSVLDVGCGPGTITVDLARRVAPGPVVGLDSAAEVVALARATTDDRAIGNLRFTVGDTYALDFDDGSFDIVHAHQVLQHLAHPVAALAELGRVCRPGGRVAARDGDYGGFTWYPADPGLDAWLDLYGAVARANGGEPDGGRHLASWARAAGFTEVTTTASAWCFSDPDDRRWWGELWADRMTESALGARAVELGLATADQLQEMAAAWRRWTAHPDGWFAVLHGEILCLR